MKMKNMPRILIFLLMGSNIIMAQTKVIKKYQKRQKVDLGDMEIKGELVTPGDFSIQVERRKRFSKSLYDRDEFNFELRNDVLNLR